MRLYVLPGACSLASHMAVEAVAQALSTDKPPFEIIVVDRSQNRPLKYLAINPLGTVPALVTDDGWLIVESFAVLLHIADRFPKARLAPPVASKLRDRVHTLLSVTMTVSQPAFQMLWPSERFADTQEAARLSSACDRSDWRRFSQGLKSKSDRAVMLRCVRHATGKPYAANL